MPAAKKKTASSNFDFGAVPVVVVASSPSKSKLPSFPMALVEDYDTMRKFEAVAKAGRLAIEAELKASGSLKYVELGVAQGQKPDNFVATEGADSKATFVFARRSSASPLTEDQVALFTVQFGEEWVEKNIETNETPETISFNPTYMDDPIWREKFQEAIRTIPNLPADAFVRTAGSSVRTVTDDTINAVFASRDPEIAERFLPLVTRLGIKVAKSVTIDLPGLLAKVGRILDLPNLKEAMASAANDPDSVLTESQDKRKRK